MLLPFFRPSTYMIRTGRATRYGATSAYTQRTHRGKKIIGIRSVFFSLYIVIEDPSFHQHPKGIISLLCTQYFQWVYVH